MTSPGDRLADRYELIEPIGSGGMGIVWRARDTRLRRTVAVKILRPQLAGDPGFVRRFESVAHEVRSLANFYVATVYDTGADGDTRFIVMELVDGPTLADLIARDGALAPARSVAIAGAAARALTAAHRGGLVHGDVKPANLLIGPDGRVRLTDFGFAQILSSGQLATVGLGRGSPYLSPEQIRGEGATPASDIYSLGVVLFQMLYGHLPRRGTRSPRLQASEGDLPAGLGAIVSRALQVDPAMRYPSAWAFAEALDVSARHLREARRPQGHGSGPVAATLPSPTVVDTGEVASATRWPRATPSAPTRIDRRRRRTGAAPALVGVAAMGVATLVALVLLSTGAQLIGGVLEATATAPPIAADQPASVTPVGAPSVAASPAPSTAPMETPSTAAAPSLPISTARPAASPRPTPTRSATPPAGGAMAAVADFYHAVEAHDWDRATARWTRSMRDRYPPDEWLVGRFANTTRIDIVRLRQTALNSRAGTATVAVSLVEYRSVEPSRRSLAGSWELVRVNGRWLLNDPHF